MRVLITGATGTLGVALSYALLARGDEVIVLTRDRQRAAGRLPHGPGGRLEILAWPDPLAAPPPAEAMHGTDAVVNLLGEPISQRWTPAVKRRIRDSRVQATRNLVRGIRAADPERRPRTLVTGSATGIYGPHGDEEVDERTAAGEDFLAGVVVAWEAEARAAQDLLRVAVMRTGVVLSPSGGALAAMLPFFRLGLGGPVAGGRQYVPWVHLDDVVRAFLGALDDPRRSGPFNLAAPRPARNSELSAALGRALRRPAFMPVPSFGVRALYGEMAQVVIDGVRAVPRRLTELGYEFRHPELEPALRDVLEHR
jgi:uncharacterized protein (TIGR01777 family)